MPTLDISLAFDDTPYLIPQLYLLVESLKGKLPKETVIHITTTEYKDILDYIKANLPNRVKIYLKPPIENLKSRCGYLLRTMEIESNADYILKIDLDILFLKNFDEILELIKTDADIYIQSENRRIISDEKIETRLWKAVYKEMGFELPDLMIPYVENHELGRPLLNSGAFVIKTSKMKELKEKWIELTRLAEKFITYNVHPNESSLTALILCNHWKWMGLHQWLHFNPIGHYRDGAFPSQQLKENCKLPDEIFMLHYHKPQWLYHLARYNQNIMELLKQTSEHIPNDWWNLPMETYNEHN